MTFTFSNKWNDCPICGRELKLSSDEIDVSGYSYSWLICPHDNGNNLHHCEIAFCADRKDFDIHMARYDFDTHEIDFRNGKMYLWFYVDSKPKCQRLSTTIPFDKFKDFNKLKKLLVL